LLLLLFVVVVCKVMQVKYKESQAIYAMKVRDKGIGGREGGREVAV
jgi:hypothetical protein